jgi:crotonobetainyl-CoA:carnitine CoA-transferase CaiB-like acyl-CoA transferase
MSGLSAAALPTEQLVLLPLSDVVVLELGSSIAAAYCGRLLAAFGATVIKVEPPDGDPMRAMPPFAANVRGPEASLSYMYLNGGKQGITLASGSASGRGLLAGLVANADVVLDAMGPGVLPAQGLPFAQISALNPATILMSITPFGNDGPYRDYVASELVLLALGGLLKLVGRVERTPIRLGGYQAQYQGGLAALAGTLAALHARALTGRGQEAEVAVQEAVAFTEWKSAIYFQATKRLRMRGGEQSEWTVLPCRDGFLGFVFREKEWPNVKRLIDDPRLEDPRFASRASRLALRQELRGLLEAWSMTRTNLEAYHEAQAAGVPAGMVTTMADLLESPQYRDRAFFDEIDHPATGPIRSPGVPVLLNGQRPRAGRAPLLAEHNDAVYGERLGLDSGELARLRARRVI